MKLRRLVTLIGKERKQMLRDSSNVAIGIVLPVLMLLVFGYGMSMDVRNIDLVIVLPESSEIGSNIIARFRNSKYFTVNVTSSSEEGVRAVKNHEADGCLFLPQNLRKNLQAGDVSILIGMNSANASVARMYENYIRQVVISAIGDFSSASGTFRGATVKNRMWFNEANESAYYMIPGVIVIIMALIGCMLTSLQMAKEYEHGNMESMFVTPMTSGEILLAKMVNNYVLGMIGLGISLLFARYLFHVPVRGNLLILLLGSSIFLLLQMAMGLLISSLTKSQFLASQIAMIVSFMPVFLLSGFLYEIPNMPEFLQYFTYLVPARYFVDFLQSVFLVGNVPENILRNLTIMSGFTVILLLLAKWKNPKLLTGGKS